MNFRVDAVFIGVIVVVVFSVTFVCQIFGKLLAEKVFSFSDSFQHWDDSGVNLIKLFRLKSTLNIL
jgi:hypothetical protein